MPLVRITADGTAATGTPSEVRALEIALAGLPAGAPVVILVHGYKFEPGHPEHCPFGHILSLRPRSAPRAVSWPRHLGFGSDTCDEGLCIAFGWPARGSIWNAHRAAARAGEALARLIRRITALRGGAVDLFAHSLGARVVLSSFPLLPGGSVRRVILLAAAETTDAALSAMEAPAGGTAEVINVVSRENALFDLLFTGLVHPLRPLRSALGAGIGPGRRGWIDLEIDCPATRDHLARMGFPVRPAAKRICHWSGYLRPGLFPLYRALLRPAGAMPLAALRPAPQERTRRCEAIGTARPLSFP